MSSPTVAHKGQRGRATSSIAMGAAFTQGWLHVGVVEAVPTEGMYRPLRWDPRFWTLSGDVLVLWQDQTQRVRVGDICLTPDSLVYQTSLTARSLLLVTPYVSLHIEVAPVEEEDGAAGAGGGAAGGALSGGGAAAAGAVGGDAAFAAASGAADVAAVQAGAAEAAAAERSAAATRSFVHSLQTVIGACRSMAHLPELVQRRALADASTAPTHAVRWATPRTPLGFACKQTHNGETAIITAVKPRKKGAKAEAAAAAAAAAGSAGQGAAGGAGAAAGGAAADIVVGSVLVSINGESAFVGRSYLEQMALLKNCHRGAAPERPLTLGFARPPSMQGVLHRRGRRKGVTGSYVWVSRFVLLRRGRLYVAATEASLMGGEQQLAAAGGVAQEDAAAAAVSEGVFELAGSCLRVLPPSEQGGTAKGRASSAFALTSGVGSLVLACAGEEELAAWCGALYYAAALANGGGFTVHLAAHEASGAPYVAPELEPEEEEGGGGSGRTRGRTLSRARSLSNGFGLLSLDNPFAFFGSPRGSSSSRADAAAAVPRPPPQQQQQPPPMPASPDGTAQSDEVRVPVRDAGTPQPSAVSAAPVPGNSVASL